MADYKGIDYGGMIPELKKDYVNMDVLFNTRRKNKNQTTTFRTSLAGGRIRTGAEAGTGYCGGIPVHCAEFDSFSVIADKPMEVNEVYPKCLEEFVASDVNSELNIIAKEWAETEAADAYKEMLAAGIFDVTADALATTTAADKVTVAIEKLLEEGWALQDILVVVNDSMYMALGREDITCCDRAVQTAEIGSALVNKFGIKGLIHMPTNIISGGVPADNTEKVEVLAYVRDLAMFHTFCENTPELRSVTDLEYTGQVTQIIGSEFYGFGIADITSAAVSYAEAPAGF